MDVSFTEEQRMLQTTTQRVVASEYSFERRAKVLASSVGWSRDLWRRFGELGLLSINMPEGDGGIDAGPVGTLLVSEVVGRGLLLEPFLSSAVVATQAIVTLGSTEQRARWLPGLASGERVAVLAHEEMHCGIDTSRMTTHAARAGDGWVLEGAKSAVYHAPMADLLLVSAKVDGGTGLFAVPAGAEGVERRDFRAVDGQRAADLLFHHVAAEARLGGDAAHELARVVDRGIAALCGEAMGTLDRVLSETVEYSRTRHQFGVPIGSFQALQHRMTDMLIQIEQARSMAYLATTRASDADAETRRAAISGAKALIGRAARRVGQEAVQLHGGMGMTDELDISHCFKRLLAFELRFGTTDEHLEICRQGLLAQ